MSRAAGIVVYRAEEGQPVEFLLLQASYPPFHWSPPKGHVDPGESELEAALRETEEESGIGRQSLLLHEDCSHMLSYKITASVAHPEDVGKEKTVTYWLGRLKGKAGLALSGEHDRLKWAGVEEAVSLANFAGMDEMWRKFHAYVLRNSSL